MSPLEVHAMLLAAGDSVAVARRRIPAGLTLETPAGPVTTRAEIPPGHKLALVPLPPGAPVLKYGQFIGWTTSPVLPGDHVHSHNLIAGEPPAAPAGTAPACAAASGLETLEPADPGHFMGYARPSGRPGTRNYVAVISSVNCSASVSRYVARAFQTPTFRTDFPNVDGVLAFTHKGGCAVDPGDPTRLLQRVLAGMARHPNIAGCVLIGLGCEVNQASALVSAQHLDVRPPQGGTPAVLNIQQSGGVRKTVEAGIAAVTRLLPSANACRRTRQSPEQLVLALNCGGSDGHSGCTANPALGVASDLLVRAGGTSVLAETPEIYGAEHLLARRAVSPAVREELMQTIRWWEDHVRRHGTTIDNNPSFGNRQGGLTTIYEKSLGAIAKAGHAALSAVYPYAGAVTARGLCFMDTPGYDPVSMTGLVAGGCTVGVFTTGRGSVYGCKPAPCIKVASNTPLFRHMEEDMDIDAGRILEGTATVASVGREIFDRIVAVASGEPTRSELTGMGDEEFVPWELGPTL